MCLKIQFIVCSFIELHRCYVSQMNPWNRVPNRAPNEWVGSRNPLRHLERPGSQRLCHSCSISSQVCSAAAGPSRASCSFTLVKSKLEADNTVTDRSPSKRVSQSEQGDDDDIVIMIESFTDYSAVKSTLLTVSNVLSCREKRLFSSSDFRYQHHDTVQRSGRKTQISALGSWDDSGPNRRSLTH